MKLRKLILITGILTMSIAGTANAAVYGTIKQDINITLQDESVYTIQKGETVNVLDKKDSEYIVALENEIKHTVSTDGIELVGALTHTNTDDTKLRAAADPEADIIDFLQTETVVLVLERQDNFYKVKVDDKEGYIYKSQINEEDLELLPYKKTVVEEVKAEVSPVSYIGEEVIAYAKNFLGGRYVYGGNSLQTGVDCSGFTQQIMKKFNVYLQRSSRSQYSSNGYKVSVDNILPGDLVFYGTNGKTIDHVAIYAGGGQIIHASDARTGIKMSKLYYGKPLIGVKRVLG